MNVFSLCVCQIWSDFWSILANKPKYALKKNNLDIWNSLGVFLSENSFFCRILGNVFGPRSQPASLHHLTILFFFFCLFNVNKFSTDLSWNCVWNSRCFRESNRFFPVARMNNVIRIILSTLFNNSLNWIKYRTWTKGQDQKPKVFLLPGDTALFVHSCLLRKQEEPLCWTLNCPIYTKKTKQTMTDTQRCQSVLWTVPIQAQPAEIITTSMEGNH